MVPANRSLLAAHVHARRATGAPLLCALGVCALRSQSRGLRWPATHRCPAGDGGAAGAADSTW